MLFAQIAVMLFVVVCGSVTPVVSPAVFFPIHIQVFQSNGFRAFLSAVTFPVVGLHFFAFHATVNAPIQSMQKGRYEGVVTSANPNGYWVFDAPASKRLHAGDVINYWAYVEVNGVD